MLKIKQQGSNEAFNNQVDHSAKYIGATLLKNIIFEEQGETNVRRIN